MKSRWMIFVSCLILLSCKTAETKTSKVCFANECFNVEVARNEEQWQKGLMFRESMPLDAGMLFIFDTTKHHPFWMKNTLIPLDIIWMDYDRTIIHIESNVPPCKEDPCPTYGPNARSLYVFEINAFQAEKSGINVGDIADFRLLPRMEK